MLMLMSADSLAAPSNGSKQKEVGYDNGAATKLVPTCRLSVGQISMLTFCDDVSFKTCIMSIQLDNR